MTEFRKKGQNLRSNPKYSHQKFRTLGMFANGVTMEAFRESEMVVVPVYDPLVGFKKIIVQGVSGGNGSS